IQALPILLALSSMQTTRKPDVKLVDLTPVTQVTKSSTFKFSKEFSIGGIVLKEGVLLLPQGDSVERTGRLVYSVPRGSISFRGQFGIPDSETEGTGEAILAIFVDGEPLQEIRAVSGQKPIRFDAGVKGAKSLMFTMTGTAAIGDAAFSSSTVSSKTTTKTTPPQETPPKLPTEMGRVNVTAPENGVTVRDGITFKWDAVPEAVSYGVEIVMITNSDTKKIPTRYLRAFSARNESFEWNFSEDVLSGEYQVSVIAFGKAGVLTKFSNSKRFKVVRK
ncbi:MAG: hypothetical protein WCG75_05380, partial [Armatimonadota bacterium]